jgi:hypothetical protein
MKRPITLPLKENKMHEHIDDLLRDGKEEDAISLIEQVWAKEAQAEKKAIADFSRRLDVLLEKRFKIKK